MSGVMGGITGAADPRFAQWLLRETGIDAQSLGVNALARAVGMRAAAAVAGDSPPGPANSFMPAAWEAGAAVPAGALDAYWARLAASAEERQALIDALVVPETWFFREREAFVALARLGIERLAKRPGDVLRVLSVPCSSGEEAYSAAMALLDAGLGAGQCGIDAIDISTAAIAAAERGVYGRNAFRGDALAFRERHFEATGDGWRVGMDVRRLVTFERANLFEWLAVHPVRYDFIFCRNVLIYFDREAQDRAIGLLRTRLADDGMIFVGPAETGLMMRHEMVSAYIPLAFGFRVPGEDEAARQTVPVALAGTNAPLLLRPLHEARAMRVASAAPPGKSATPFASTPVTRTGHPPAPRPWAATARPQYAAASARSPVRQPAPGLAHEAPLAEARRLADRGELDAARRLALQATRASAQDSDAWYLLGLIADAQGHPDEARDHYRKAVYLDPAHYEALTHLAALLEVQGDGEGARRLMRRAARAAPRMRNQGGADA